MNSWELFKDFVAMKKNNTVTTEGLTIEIVLDDRSLNKTRWDSIEYSITHVYRIYMCDVNRPLVSMLSLSLLER